MNQQLFNIAATLAMFSMAVALFSLKKEYEGFRRDVVKIVGGLGILVKNGKNLSPAARTFIRYLKKNDYYLKEE